MHDNPWRQAAQAKLNQKTKPLGSLGYLEEVAVKLCEVQQTLSPSADPARVVIFAADHGVADDGVSLYPKAVTAQMMLNFAKGGAAATVLARQLGLTIEVIDVGVDADLSAWHQLGHYKVANGSKNIRTHAAMSQTELVQAMGVGAQAMVRAKRAGCKVVLLGEMGIANTTAAAAIVSVLTKAPAVQVVGSGTGVSKDQLQRKLEIVQLAIARFQATPGNHDALAVLRELGGLEIAALTGAILEAQQLGLTVLIDGFIVTAAALVAIATQKACQAHLLFAHRGAELGHELALQALRAPAVEDGVPICVEDGVPARPLLQLDLRLGEASGALLAFPLLRAACTVINDMASFAEAGVSEAG